jgi:hypothetical protein
MKAAVPRKAKVCLLPSRLLALIADWSIRPTLGEAADH